LLIFKKYRDINRKDFRIGITGQSPFPVLGIQMPAFSSLDLHLLPRVETARAECSQEIGVENGYLALSTILVSPINPIPLDEMTVLL
jgi:hypothetical protein